MSTLNKIAIAQQCAVDDFQENLNVIEQLIHEAAQKAAEIIFFPENCLYVRLDKNVLPPYLELEDSVLKQIKNLAASYKIAVHLGGVGVLIDGHKRNASLFIDEKGMIQHSYSKQKLFDIELPGKHSYRESDAYEHGSKNAILKWQGWALGQTICYDLRFAEIYAEYAQSKVDILLAPSSFLVPTGQAHWHILNKARAIESQSYMIAAAQSGNHKGRHQSFGHSLVVDPWGEVLVDMETRENQIEVIDIDKKRITEVREQMPMRP